MQNEDLEFGILAALASSLKDEYAGVDDMWEGSPFAWIRARPSRQVGKIGEQLVAGWLAARGFNVTRSPDSEADRVVENKRVEIKFSTLWKSGSYKFQQLRDQNYDIAICLGISPFSAHCWVLEKSEILHQWREVGNLQSQHGGAKGTDTAWLTVDPTWIPDWLSPWGGTLQDAFQVLSKLTGHQPGNS